MLHGIIGKTYIIYCHRNKVNGKCYIGQTKHSDNPNRRWKDGEGYIYNTHFWRAIQKYGWNNFEHIILAKDLSKEEADELEIYYIQKYNSTNNEYGYNIASGGSNGGGHPFSEEARQKIGDANRGKVISKETKQKMSESHIGKIPWNKGKHISKETKQKISNTLTGTKLSEETKKKISEANIGKHKEPKSEQTKQKISNSLKGKKRVFSEEHRKNLSIARRRKKSSKNRKWINNNGITKFVKPEELQDYLNNGWLLGKK